MSHIIGFWATCHMTFWSTTRQSENHTTILYSSPFMEEKGLSMALRMFMFSCSVTWKCQTLGSKQWGKESDYYLHALFLDMWPLCEAECELNGAFGWNLVCSNCSFYISLSLLHSYIIKHANQLENVLKSKHPT